MAAGLFLGSSSSESESAFGLDRGLAFLVLLVFFGLCGGDLCPLSFSESVADTNLGLDEEEDEKERDLEREGDLEADREPDGDLDLAGLLSRLDILKFFFKKILSRETFREIHQELFGILENKL